MNASLDLISFVTDLADDDDQYINAYLEERNINHTGFKEKILGYLNEKRAEVLITEGRRFKQDFYKEISGDAAFEKFSEAEIAYGFRKLEELEGGEREEIKKDELKLRLLQELVKKRNNA